MPGPSPRPDAPAPSRCRPCRMLARADHPTPPHAGSGLVVAAVATLYGRMRGTAGRACVLCLGRVPARHDWACVACLDAWGGFVAAAVSLTWVSWCLDADAGRLCLCRDAHSAPRRTLRLWTPAPMDAGTPTMDACAAYAKGSSGRRSQMKRWLLKLRCCWLRCLLQAALLTLLTRGL
jgi:hypothetical protein